MLVLLILAIVWAAVLGPSLLRRRAERSSSDSIGAFHRHLRVLERAGPVTMAPAYRLGTSRPSRSPFRLADFDGDVPSSPSGPDQFGSPGRRLGLHRPDPYFRADACRRRRQVLTALLVLLVGTGLLGAVPTLRPALVVTVVGAVLLLAYVGLLVHLRTLAVERETKLRYLPQAPIEPEAPAAVRRVATR